MATKVYSSGVFIVAEQGVLLYNINKSTFDFTFNSGQVVLLDNSNNTSITDIYDNIQDETGTPVGGTLELIKAYLYTLVPNAADNGGATSDLQDDQLTQATNYQGKKNIGKTLDLTTSSVDPLSFPFFLDSIEINGTAITPSPTISQQITNSTDLVGVLAAIQDLYFFSVIDATNLLINSGTLALSEITNFKIFANSGGSSFTFGTFADSPAVPLSNEDETNENIKTMRALSKAAVDALDLQAKLTDTQPVSIASLPLPSGAAQDGTDITTPFAMPAGGVGIRGWLSAIWTKINASLAVTGTFWQATQPVSGTFFQATQPVSAASLPLPSGATLEATQLLVKAAIEATTKPSDIQSVWATPTMLQEIQITGLWRGKTAYAFNLIGQRNGFTSTSVMNDIKEYDNAVAEAAITSNSTLDIISSSANDTAAGTGVRTVKVVYINNLGNLVESSAITLNGTTLVTSVLTGVQQVLWMETATVGSGNVAAGNIRLRINGGTVEVEQITTGANKSRSAIFQVPTGYTGYIANWLTSAVNNDQDCRLRATVNTFDRSLNAGVYHFLSQKYAAANTSIPAHDIWMKIPALSRVKVGTVSGGTAATVRCNTNILVIIIQN